MRPPSSFLPHRPRVRSGVGRPSPRLLRGTEALEFLASPASVNQWRHLERACPWATPFQGPDFTLAWIAAHGSDVEPVVVCTGGDQALAGLLVLVVRRGSPDLVTPGDAEHPHGWLATAEDRGEFIEAALARVRREIPGCVVRIPRLAAGMPLDALVGDVRVRVAARTEPETAFHAWPDARRGDDASAALSRAKGLIDFMRGAETGRLPFLDDPALTDVVDRLARMPESPLVVRVVEIDGEMASASIGLASVDGRVLPWFSAASPVWFRRRPDAAPAMTTVRSLVSHPRALSALRGDVRRAVRRALPEALVRMVRTDRAEIRRKIAVRVRHLRERMWSTSCFRMMPVDAHAASRFPVDRRLRENCFEDLARFQPSESWQTRQRFLSQAAARLADGALALTHAEDGRLLHYQWYAWTRGVSHVCEVSQTVRLPSRDATAFDSYTVPAARGRGLQKAGFRHGHRDVAGWPGVGRIWGGVLADNASSRKNVEGMGARYLCTLRRRCRLFRVKIDAYREDSSRTPLEREIETLFRTSAKRTLDVRGIEPYDDGEIDLTQPGQLEVALWTIADHASRALDDAGRTALLATLRQRL